MFMDLRDQFGCQWHHLRPSNPKNHLIRKYTYSLALIVLLKAKGIESEFMTKLRVSRLSSKYCKRTSSKYNISPRRRVQICVPPHSLNLYLSDACVVAVSQKIIVERRKEKQLTCISSILLYAPIIPDRKTNT